MELINLFKEPSKFSYLPKNARYGIVFLFLSWAGHFVLFYLTFQKEIPREMFLQQLAISVMICYFVVRLKNWARILCVYGNIVIMMYYLYWFSLFISIGKIDLFVLSLFVCILFGMTVYYLSRPDTVAFFKVQSPKPKRNDEPEDNAPKH
ncbi:hypothetical protein D3OALGA1CA_4810 [Olavius algarvensis associated proteobacterium Delta 3]|nr:hypothetical protein D3OALGB2SA_2086 [Olavius algarvensis associated proteobacterium Delta 3]CAB5157205.1 hypothetical protein D3OALGA1CA_4810 [Olavius algarvensis associated proteobacterium Delta 3]